MDRIWIARIAIFRSKSKITGQRCPGSSHAAAEPDRHDHCRALGDAVMLDIGQALREAGNQVLYIAVLGKASEVDHQDELEVSADPGKVLSGAPPQNR